MEFNLSVADAIRAELARQRKTQVELATALHLSPAAVSRMLSGKVAFDLVELKKTATFLRMPVSRLVREAERAGRVEADS